MDDKNNKINKNINNDINNHFMTCPLKSNENIPSDASIKEYILIVDLK